MVAQVPRPAVSSSRHQPAGAALLSRAMFRSSSVLSVEEVLAHVLFIEDVVVFDCLGDTGGPCPRHGP